MLGQRVSLSPVIVPLAAVAFAIVAPGPLDPGEPICAAGNLVRTLTRGSLPAFVRH